MRRVRALLRVSTFVLVAAPAVGARGPRPTAALAQSPRLVVLESFLKAGCLTCAMAAKSIERLAADYQAAGSSVFFLEHDVDAPTGNRIDRWYDAEYGGNCAVPWVMVDSGRGASCGEVDYSSVYRQLVDAALATPPEADLQATFRRVGDGVRVTVRLTNRSGRVLGNADLASVSAMVFERTRVHHTSRFVRASGQADIVDDLADGQTAAFAIDVPAVPTDDWSRTDVVVLVDHQPDSRSTRYAALQAAVASPDGPPLDTARLYMPGASRGRPWPSP